MFKCVGIPIAMGNATENIKLHAKYLTKSNYELIYFLFTGIHTSHLYPLCFLSFQMRFLERL